MSHACKVVPIFENVCWLSENIKREQQRWYIKHLYD